MMSENFFEFEWDDEKAFSNFKKHGVSFKDAMQVFRDPLLMTRYDDEHSGFEERWVSLGRHFDGRIFVIVHTFVEVSTATALVRLISVRPATKRERQQYEQG